MEKAMQHLKALPESAQDRVARGVLDLVERLGGEAEHDARIEALQGAWQDEVSPVTRRLVGLARPQPDQPVPDEDDYYRHLEAKHSRHLHDRDA